MLVPFSVGANLSFRARISSFSARNSHLQLRKPDFQRVQPDFSVGAAQPVRTATPRSPSVVVLGRDWLAEHPAEVLTLDFAHGNIVLLRAGLDIPELTRREHRWR
jgi:hypothetical protein